MKKRLIKESALVALVMVLIFLVTQSAAFAKNGALDIPPIAWEKERIPFGMSQALLNVEIADTAVERRMGLSGRTTIPEDAGMLFVFAESGFHSIWMKDMRLDIDIIWLDADLKVVDTKVNATPASYPEVFTSAVPARYVLEVPSGFVREHNIQNGAGAIFLKKNDEKK